jgi:hypothetical protein
VGKVRAFNQEMVRGRASARVRVVSPGSFDEGPYRLRSASDAAWSGHSGYGHNATFGQKCGTACLAVIRVIPPVFALLACCMGWYLYRDTPMPLSLAGVNMPWLTGADLLVPVGFFCVFLTNRRFGPAYAFAQIIVASAVIVAVVLFGGSALNDFVRADTVPSMRDAASFGAAFFVASFISIIVFDGTRGPNWWTAPLFGCVVASTAFVVTFFPCAYAGTDTPWVGHALLYAGLLAGEGVLLLVPYWFLRGMIPPISGYGGY